MLKNLPNWSDRLRRINQIALGVSIAGFIGIFISTLLSRGLQKTFYHANVYRRCEVRGDAVECPYIGTLYPDMILWMFLLVDVFYYGFAVLWPGHLEAQLKNYANPYRWLSYLISSTLMILVLFGLFPAVSLWTVLMACGLNICMIGAGFAMDWTEGVRKYFFLGLGALPYLVNLFVYFDGVAGMASELPVFVWFAIIVTFGLFSVFIGPAAYQIYGQRTLDRFLMGEAAFVVVGLTAKIFLAVDVHVGILVRSK